MAAMKASLHRDSFTLFPHLRAIAPRDPSRRRTLPPGNTLRCRREDCCVIHAHPFIRRRPSVHHPRALVLAAASAALLVACATPSSTGPMSFFVTSAGMGKGADLGGLAGADAHCQKLAAGAGA